MSPTQSAEQEKIGPVGAQPTGPHRDLCALTHSGDHVQLQWRGPWAAGPCCMGQDSLMDRLGAFSSPSGHYLYEFPSTYEAVLSGDPQCRCPHRAESAA